MRTPPLDSFVQHSKVSQYQTLKQYFLTNTTSRRKASKDTGIYSGTICRRVSELKRDNQVKVARRDICPISGEFVEFLSAKF